MNTFRDIDMHNIYSDLMKVFIINGHKPYIVTPREERSGEETELQNYDNYAILSVKIGDFSNVSLVKKGVSTVTLKNRYYRAIRRYLKGISFDLILYSTPPITLVEPIIKLKKQYKCTTYLMLKDIFPQNAVDLRMFSKHSLIYKYFRRQELKLYRVSDYIGCMSRANMNYLKQNNPEISQDIIEICPNGIIPCHIKDRTLLKKSVRKKYHISNEAIIYIYGGNLGKPQGIPHLIKRFKENVNKSDRFFIICGKGSEYKLIEQYIKEEKPSNIRLISFLPKEEYDNLVAGCDVGLVFLDNRFTIPNYPSRILSYMENEMPMIVCTDAATDVGFDAYYNGYGFCCTADDPKAFTECIDKMTHDNIKSMGDTARKYLESYFTSEKCYAIIKSHWNTVNK